MANEINATVQNAAQVASTNETLTEGTQKKFAVKVNRLQVFEVLILVVLDTTL